MTATLTIRPVTIDGKEIRSFEVTCPHLTTLVRLEPGLDYLTDSFVVASILAGYVREGWCDCTAELRRLYGGASERQN